MSRRTAACVVDWAFATNFVTANLGAMLAIRGRILGDVRGRTAPSETRRPLPAPPPVPDLLQSLLLAPAS